MLKLSASLSKVPIISLRTGHQIGTALAPIINPDNLKIEGWYCTNIFENSTFILQTADIREISRLGIAVNDVDALSYPEDLIRLQKVLEIDFDLLGKLVVTDTRKILGKVEDYAVNIEDFYLYRLFVVPRALKALAKDQLIINRSQVIAVTDKRIVVKDLEATEQVPLRAPVRVPEV